MLLPFHADLRIGDAVALDVADIQMSARKGYLIVYGKGGKVRQAPHPPAAPHPLTGWLDERPAWKNVATERALCSSTTAAADCRHTEVFT